MAGVDFDRGAFIPSVERSPRPQARVLGGLILAIAFTALAFLGYKVLSDSQQRAITGANDHTLDAIQQQLTKMEKRLDQLERRRKSSAPEPDAAPDAAAKKEPAKEPPSKKAEYTIAPEIRTKTQPSSTLAARQPLPAPPATQPTNNATASDREAWQATTDRLADVVGVVGSQESEISQTREQLNALLAQTRRNAVQFELRRGSSRQTVGPVSMVFKGTDPRSQRYSVCVYMEDKCVELKDRTVNEVVVFLPSRHSAPLELVATKVLRDRIVGYLEVPSEKPPP
jgi:hypothetical protein